MESTIAHVPDDADRLDAVIAAFLKACESGSQPDPAEWLKRYPDLAKELGDFFADRERFERWAKPVRAAGSETTRPVAGSGPAVGGNVTYFGDYELQEELARGGMGVVYRARQVSLNRTVAVKMILAGQYASEAAMQRFQMEAAAAATLDHPHLVPIYEVGKCQGQHYFSMKLIEGGSLSQLKKEGPDKSDRDKPERLRKVAALMVKVAQAVHHAHQRGILHRDLKPANILLDRNGEPHITDFGLAKRLSTDSSVTHSGAIVGTPSYMAPEQAEGRKEAATTAADIYSLGAILYELLTGRPPVRGETVLDTLALLQTETPPLPSRLNPAVDRNLETICLKCLEKDPGRRYTSAAALAEDLEHWRADEPISARPVTALQLMGLWVRKNLRVMLWTVLIGFVCFGLGTGMMCSVSVQFLVQRAVEVYANFPSSTPPFWLTSLAQMPGELALLGLFVGFFLTASLGLWTFLVVRPRDATGDLIAGLSSGLIGGLNAYLFGMGWAISLALIVVPSLSDIFVYTKAVQLRETADASKLDLGEVVAQHYPDLKRLPPKERVGMAATKIIADQVVASQHAIWLGLLLTLGFGLAAGVIQTMAAGHLLRGGARLRSVLFPYAEITVAAQAFLLLLAMFLMLGPAETAVLLVPATVTALAVVGVFRGWWMPLRHTLYIILLFTWGRLFSGLRASDMQGIGEYVLHWHLDVIGYVSAVVILIYYAEHRRRRITAAR